MFAEHISLAEHTSRVVWMHVSFGASVLQCVDAVCALLQCVVAVCVSLQCAVAVPRGSDVFLGAARGGSAGEGVVLQFVGVLL